MKNMKKLMKMFGLGLVLSFSTSLKAKSPTYKELLVFWQQQEGLTSKPQPTTSSTLRPAVLQLAPVPKAIDPQKLLLQQQWDQLQEQLTSKDSPFETRMQALKQLIETFGIKDYKITFEKSAEQDQFTFSIIINHNVASPSTLIFNGTESEIKALIQYLKGTDILPKWFVEEIIYTIMDSSPSVQRLLALFENPMNTDTIVSLQKKDAVTLELEIEIGNPAQEQSIVCTFTGAQAEMLDLIKYLQKTFNLNSPVEQTCLQKILTAYNELVEQDSSSQPDAEDNNFPDFDYNIFEDPSKFQGMDGNWYYCAEDEAQAKEQANINRIPWKTKAGKLVSPDPKPAAAE